MTATISKIKSRVANWRELELNPIVVKELRQSVRSWAVTGMLLLFLVVLFITSLAFLVDQTFEVAGNEQLGGDIFRAFIVILAGASILFIPLYVGVRMAAERQENNTDLLYVTTLSPGQVIRGKFFCGAYLSLLLFSAFMPFMALTNLLRGVDLPTVFFILMFLFVVVCAAILLAIFIACLPVSRPFKMLLALGEFGVSFWIVGGVIFSAFSMMRSGVGSMMAEKYFWSLTTTVGVVVAAAGGLFFILSVALISPPSANRAFWPRIYLTAIWLIGALLAGAWAWVESDPQLILTWTYFGTLLLVASLVVTVSNNDPLSVRVRRTIPAAGLKRIIAFVFYNGAAGGVVWTMTLILITFFGTIGFPTMLGASLGKSYSWPASVFSEFLDVYPPLLIYIFAYALTGVFIQRRFLPLRPAKFAGLLAILVAGLSAIGPSIVLFLMNNLSWKNIEAIQLGNASNLFVATNPGQRHAHLIFAGAWLVIILALNAKWFVTQVKNFRPPPADVPPELE
jgi:hypothetical protein